MAAPFIQPGTHALLGPRTLELLDLLPTSPHSVPKLIVIAVNQDFFNGAVTGYLRFKTQNVVDKGGNLDPIVVVGPLEAASVGLTDASGMHFAFTLSDDMHFNSSSQPQMLHGSSPPPLFQADMPLEHSASATNEMFYAPATPPSGFQQQDLPLSSEHFSQSSFQFEPNVSQPSQK